MLISTCRFWLNNELILYEQSLTIYTFYFKLAVHICGIHGNIRDSLKVMSYEYELLACTIWIATTSSMQCDRRKLKASELAIKCILFRLRKHTNIHMLCRFLK